MYSSRGIGTIAAAKQPSKVLAHSIPRFSYCIIKHGQFSPFKRIKRLEVCKSYHIRSEKRETSTEERTQECMRCNTRRSPEHWQRIRYGKKGYERLAKSCTYRCGLARTIYESEGKNIANNPNPDNRPEAVGTIQWILFLYPDHPNQNKAAEKAAAPGIAMGKTHSGSRRPWFLISLGRSQYFCTSAMMITFRNCPITIPR